MSRRIDEFFAESWQAYLGANDPNSLWPTVTRARLEACTPAMHTLFEGIDVDLERWPARQVLYSPGNVPNRAVGIERVDRDGPGRGRGR